MLALQFYAFGGMYGVVLGESPDNVHVEYIYTETSELIEDADSRDMEV